MAGAWRARQCSARERVVERLARARDKGYEIALVWPDGDWDGTTQDDPLHFSTEAQQGLLDFMRRTSSP